MDESSKLTRLETLMEVVGADVKDTKNEVREIRKENEAWRHAHEKATQDKLDHARRNAEQKFDAMERKLAEKVSLRDLEANQRDSDERYETVKAALSGKASSESVNVLSERVEVIAKSGDSLKDHVIKWVLTSVLAATLGAGGFFAVKAATERHAPVAQVAPQHAVDNGGQPR